MRPHVERYPNEQTHWTTEIIEKLRPIFNGLAQEKGLVFLKCHFYSEFPPLRTPIKIYTQEFDNGGCDNGPIIQDIPEGAFGFPKALNELIAFRDDSIYIKGFSSNPYFTHTLVRVDNVQDPQTRSNVIEAVRTVLATKGVKIM